MNIFLEVKFSAISELKNRLILDYPHSKVRAQRMCGHPEIYRAFDSWRIPFPTSRGAALHPSHGTRRSRSALQQCHLKRCNEHF